MLISPAYKIMGRKHNYPSNSWDIYSLGNFGFSSISCSSSSLLADEFIAK